MSLLFYLELHLQTDGTWTRSTAPRDTAVLTLDQRRAIVATLMKVVDDLAGELGVTVRYEATAVPISPDVARKLLD